MIVYLSDLWYILNYTKVFEKYLNYDKKIIIRNKKVECEECKEMKKNKSMIVKV